MEEITGGAIDFDAFDQYLQNWQTILDRRIDQTIEAISAIDGIAGLILAGSGGRNALWPLSDIDLLPIFEGLHINAYDHEIDAVRNRLMKSWKSEGWRTGVDIGRIRFAINELKTELDLPNLLDDDRWFYGLDKGYQSRAVFDQFGGAAALSIRLTSSRFQSDLVTIRLDRFRSEAHISAEQYRQAIAEGQHMQAAASLRAATQWMYIWKLERWGERDNSLARVGTRFEHLARQHDRSDLVQIWRQLTESSDEMVVSRLALAPAWVHDRHQCSYAARTRIGEATTEIEDARDVLRVCSMYEIRLPQSDPPPAWLAVRTAPEAISAQTAMLAESLETWFE